ncbi:hypothetical protein C8R45DRAFT_1079924 [Mycena sanguinolenta]|nr:hypothetical protein C8R45DRAFT_1079924 [Mycena sanguinolenta]
MHVPRPLRVLLPASIQAGNILYSSPDQHQTFLIGGSYVTPLAAFLGASPVHTTQIPGGTYCRAITYLCPSPSLSAKREIERRRVSGHGQEDDLFQHSLHPSVQVFLWLTDITQQTEPRNEKAEPRFLWARPDMFKYKSNRSLTQDSFRIVARFLVKYYRFGGAVDAMASSFDLLIGSDFILPYSLEFQRDKFHVLFNRLRGCFMKRGYYPAAHAGLAEKSMIMICQSFINFCFASDYNTSDLRSAHGFRKPSQMLVSGSFPLNDLCTVGSFAFELRLEELLRRSLFAR